MDKRLAKKEIRGLSIYPLLILEDYFPHRLRQIFFRGLGGVLLLIFFVLFLGTMFKFAGPEEMSGVAASAIRHLPRVGGLFLLFFSAWILVFLAEAFARALYYHNRSWKIRGKAAEISSEVASVFYTAPDGDIIRAFLYSSLGREIMIRAGVTPKDLGEFLEHRENILELDILDLQKAGVSNMVEFSNFLYKSYPDLSAFLFHKGISEKHYTGAVEWAVRVEDEIKFGERWWGKERLSQLGSLGRFFAYGTTYRLEKYGHELTKGTASIFREFHWEEEVKGMMAALAKAKEANVIITGDDAASLSDIVHEFAFAVDGGAVPPELVHKRVFVLDTNVILAATKEKGAFEEEFFHLLNEAGKAGNVVLVFENFSAFISGAKAVGSDVLDILNPYLASPGIHVVATAPTSEYHAILGPAGEISRFERVLVKEPDPWKTIMLLEDAATVMERRKNVLFTFSSIDEILRSAENYMTEGALLDRATDLLTEIPTYIREKGKHFITKEDVLDFVRQKTNIPVGEITSDERVLLQNLETELHKYVVGQNEAVKAISESMRRSRAGVRNPKKPIGSFLFLGPTGVGKTETAKALARVFFGAEEKMVRFDMSEYEGEGSIERLIGSFESGHAGTFSTALRENPYGVLLLDEFEKAHKDVANLFLQILDEGFFSDMRGKRVNARNIIFIATSNAGSDLMIKAMEEGEDLQGHKGHIMDTIISRGIFRPELLNRFDGVILFHSLKTDDLKNIARIMAEGLKKRLKDERGLDLVVNDALVDSLLQAGNDPLFGGRPMARAVKEKIEKVIADKIIRGEIRTGSIVELTPEELADDKAPVLTSA